MRRRSEHSSQMVISEGLPHTLQRGERVRVGYRIAGELSSCSAPFPTSCGGVGASRPYSHSSHKFAASVNLSPIPLLGGIGILYFACPMANSKRLGGNTAAQVLS